VRITKNQLRKIVNEEITRLNEESAGGHTGHLAQLAFDAVEDFMEQNAKALLQNLSARLKRSAPVYAKGDDAAVQQVANKVADEVVQLMSHNNPIKNAVRRAIASTVNRVQQQSPQAAPKRSGEKMKSVASKGKQ
jgi:hypothetical protein